MKYGLSSLQKKSYSGSYTLKHIYQNQKKKFPWGLSTKRIWTKDEQMQIIAGEQKHTPGLSSSRVWGIHREVSPGWHCPAHHSGFAERLLSS